MRFELLELASWVMFNHKQGQKQRLIGKVHKGGLLLYVQNVFITNNIKQPHAQSASCHPSLLSNGQNTIIDLMPRMCFSYDPYTPISSNSPFDIFLLLNYRLIKLPLPHLVEFHQVL